LASGLFFASIAACSSAQSGSGGPDSSTGTDSEADTSVHDSSANDASEGGSLTDAGADSSADSGRNDGDASGGDASDGGQIDFDGSDGSVTDTGTADNYVPLGDGGPSLCNNEGGAFLFCDGFEDTNLSDHWTQTNYANAAPPQADSVHFYRGTHALHARTFAVGDAGGPAYANVQKLASSGSWAAHFFTRFFVYQPSPIPPSAEGFLDLVSTTSPYPGIELLSNPGGGLAAFTYTTSMNQAWTTDAGADLALDQWVCFEFEVDTFNGVSHAYMNDVEITALAGTNLQLPSLGNVSVGMGFFSPVVGQGQEDAWIDEVAVSTSRIGCSN
jgi:hypothetical protein